MSGYNCISGENEYTVIIEKSKFICNARQIENEEQAKEFIALIRKRHSLANHGCYAYIADDKGIIQKFSDDGEPQGTAGLPMLNVLKTRKIYKTVVVVTRYFGGIKLGTGGLTRAYGGAVSACLDSAKILSMQSADFFEVVTDYDGYVKIFSKKNNVDFAMVNVDFSDVVKITFAVKNENLTVIEKFHSFINDLTKGSAKMTRKYSDYYNF